MSGINIGNAPIPEETDLEDSEIQCTRKDDCPSGCHGDCGCERCFESYNDWLSLQ